MRQYETYKCEKCGNEIEVQKVGGGTLTCCGEEMKCITENLRRLYNFFILNRFKFIKFSQDKRLG